LAFSQISQYKIYNIGSEDGLLSDNVECIFQDSYGFLWIGSSDGIVRWDGYTFKKYTHAEGDINSLSNNIVYCIFEDSHRRLWVGTINGLNYYNPTLDIFSKIKIDDGFRNVPVNVIKEDSKHRLWLATSDGLCNYNHDTKKYLWRYTEVAKPNGLSDGVIFSMDIDKEDNIWLGTFSGGLNKYTTTTGNFSRFLHDPKVASSICSNKIKKLLVDRKGNVWAGSTDNGISMLNKEGRVVKHYKNFISPQDGKNSPNIISCIYQEKNARIWVGLSDQSLFFWDPIKDVFIPFLNPVYKKYHITCHGITSMHEDSFGNLWFGSERDGLFYTNTSKNIFAHYFQNYATAEGLSNAMVNSFCQDKSGTWLGTNGGGLDYLDKKKNKIISYTTKSGISSLAIQDIKTDATGNLWIATRGGGVTKFNPSNGAHQSFIKDPYNKNSLVYNDVTSIVIDDSLIWMGTYGEGVCIYNTYTQQFYHHKNNTHYNFNMLTPGWTNHILKDSKKRIWIGSYGGLYCYAQNKFQAYVHSKDSTSISNHDINMIAEDTKGNIWVITVAGGLELFNEKTKSFVHYSKLYNLPLTLKSIVTDEKGLLWMGSNDGLICFNPVTKKQQRFGVSDGLQGDFFNLKSASRNSLGELFFGGNNGFNVFQPKNIKDTFHPAPFYFTDLSVFGIEQKPNDESSALEKNLLLTETLNISYHQSFFTIGFTDINFYSPTKTKYAYKLEGLYDKWIDNQSERKISFTNLPAGDYVLKIKYTLPNGEWTEGDKQLKIIVSPAWWNTWWFRTLAFIFLAVSLWLIYKQRVRNIKKRNDELEIEVRSRTFELSERNSDLLESNDEIQQQKVKLEEYNEEVVRQSNKILNQQEYILNQNQELEKVVEKLSLSDETKNIFFNILAHDLKGPVNAIGSLTDLLLNNISTMSSKETEDFCRHIQKSSQSTRQLLYNLLDWASTQSSHINYTPIGINVSDLVCRNLNLLEQQFLQKNIHVSNLTHHEDSLFADQNMIDTVVRNILSNAVKYTPENGTITIESIVHLEEIELRIIDSGVGMEVKELEDIFRLEKRISKTGTNGEKGTGLGLVIVKEFIALNKGTLKVESSIGNGTVFTIQLPKASHNVPAEIRLEYDMTSSEEIPTIPFLSEADLQSIKGNRVLIVEDNIAMRNHLKFLLSSTFEISEAENGQEALRVAAEVQPMLVITDMVMPIMNGLDLCRALKNDQSTSHIPVIILTSHDNEESKLSGYYAGADIYLTKPLKKEILFQIVFNIIQSRELLRQKLLSSEEVIETLALNPLDHDFVEKINAFIEMHIEDQALDVDLIVRHMAMSRSVLYAKFKAITGQGVNEYIRLVKLRKSKELLLNGSLSINEIADAVGFNSASYFIRCFVKEYERTPTEFRDRRK